MRDYKQILEEARQTVSQQTPPPNQQPTQPADDGQEEQDSGQEQQPTDDTPYQNIYTYDPSGNLVTHNVPVPTTDELGKIYMLRKIYSRLVTVNNILDNFSDNKLDEVKKKVGEGMDIFNMAISNYETYKDKADTLIKNYQGFLQTVADEIETVLKRNYRRQ